MTGFMNDTTRDRVFTKRWNNGLTIGLGVPTLLFGIVALTANSMSDRAAFLVVAVLTAF